MTATPKTIKRVWLAALVCAIMSLTGTAQTHFSSRVDIGGHGGMTFSEVMFHPAITQKFGMGETFGVMFRYSEENHFGLVAELNFVQRGWAENFEEMPYSYHRTLNYIELPVMSHIYFGRRGKFFFNAGPEVALYLGDKISSNFDYRNIGAIPELTAKGRHTEQLDLKVTQKLDFGIVAGLGGEFSINRRNSLTLEARLYYGIGNVFPAGRQDDFQSSNQLSISATAGYWFRLK